MTFTNRVHIFQRDHLRELFRCAVARQTEVMVQNILGHGIDIPLLGLREASREVTGQVHELFTDESYKISQCFLLSTSQVGSTTTSGVSQTQFTSSHNSREHLSALLSLSLIHI